MVHICNESSAHVLFSSLVTLALVHYLSFEFFLYWKYLWLDIPVHILGTITVAFGIATAPFFALRSHII